MELHALPFQPSGADGTEAKTTSQELQPDGGEQRGGLEGGAGSICVPGLAALLLHARDQHHNLVESLQPQLDRKQQNSVMSKPWTTLFSVFLVEVSSIRILINLICLATTLFLV